MRRKVTVVGAGMTGGAMTQLLASTGYIDTVLIDIVEGLPQGKALDISESAPYAGFNGSVTGTNDWQDTAGSEVVVVTSGIPRKPGMTREDLIKTNAGIVAEVTRNAVAHSPNAVFIIFANPMDAMCHVTMKSTSLPRERIIGQGGMLDSTRYRTFIAWECGASPQDVHAHVLGGHTEATMVPIVSTAMVGGVPLTSLIPSERIDAAVQRTKNGGAEIVALLKTGSAFYAPAVATVEMVESVLLDKNRIIPCCIYTRGEYGIRDAFVGLPIKVGREGIVRVYEPPLADGEIAAIRKAGDAVKELAALV